MGFRKLGRKEWLVKIAFYRNARSCVRVSGTFSDDFLVQVGLHQDSSVIKFFVIYINVKKTNVMISSENLERVRKEGR